MTGKITDRRPKNEITEPQHNTLNEIRLFLNKQKYPPEIKKPTDIFSISHYSAHDQVSQLVCKGYMERQPRIARGLVITEKARNLI